MSPVSGPATPAQTAGSGVHENGMPPELDPRHLRRRVLQLAVIALLVVAVLVAMPGLGDVRRHLAHASLVWLLAALVLKLGAMLAFVAAFRAVYCERLAWRLSAQIAIAELAANVLLPTGGAGGLALGAWALQRGGMPTAHIARRTVALFLITSSVNFVAAILAGVLLALDLAGSAPPGLALAPAALAVSVALAVFAVPRVRPLNASGVGWISTIGRTLADGIADSVALVRARRPLLILGAVGYMAGDAAALAAAFHAVGSAPAFGTLVLAYVLGQLGGLIPLPVGIGGTDGGLIAAFVLYGTPVAAATAAVVAYRAFQLGLPTLLGPIAFSRLRRTLARSPAPAALCEPMTAFYQQSAGSARAVRLQ